MCSGASLDRFTISASSTSTIMDETESLQQLESILNELSESMLDVHVHARHIHLVDSQEALQFQAISAREMLAESLAAPESVWIPILEKRVQSVDMGTLAGVEELLSLFERAEEDYLSIEILKRHISLLVEQHALYQESERPAALGEIFSDEWTREAIAGVVEKGSNHLTQSHVLFDVQRDWELERLENTQGSIRDELIDHVDALLLNRLRQPHTNSDETLQAYSTFTSNYKPAQNYESLLVAASKTRSVGVKGFNRREGSESALVSSGYSLEAYSSYLTAERRAKQPDLPLLSGAHERAIAEAAKRSFGGATDADAALMSFWCSYTDALRIGEADPNLIEQTYRRALRSVPGSGELYARYIRFLEHIGEDDVAETVADTFNTALATNLIQKDVEQIVPLFLARAGFEKRRLAPPNIDGNLVLALIEILEQGVQLVQAASPSADSRLRLEKYLTEVYLRIADLPENAIAVWQTATTTKAYKSSYLAWIAYTDILIKLEQHDQARTVFSDLAYKAIDWPEAIWEAWALFEHEFGTIEEIEECLDKIEKAKIQTNARRAKEAEKASYQAMQQAMEYQAANVPVADIIQTKDSNTTAPMDVDETSSTTDASSKKRKAEGSPAAEDSKKLKIEPPLAPLKRDRENSTVFVADLPDETSDEELKTLFKDCGEIREIKQTQLQGVLVATVEFVQRDSVLAALTKDKKRIRDQEISVHLAWKSTLYVTNYPENADDTFIRDLFGQYGTLFDVRWPSKKYKSTRRFVYVQFTSPTSAEKALELHGRELTPGQPMSVYISNPERKKERTDADADAREVYVAGLSKFTTKADLETIFKTYGTVKDIRMATDANGNCKGFAFIEYEEEKDAHAALAANNHELKKRRLAVTLSNPSIRARNRNVETASGFGRRVDERNRSVRVRNLPDATQEGLLQQVLEKHARVKRVEVFIDKKEALIELSSPAEAGKLLLRSDPISFQGNDLEIIEENLDAGSSKRPMAPPPVASAGSFVPRKAVSRPKAGIGHTKNLGKGLGSTNVAQGSNPGPSQSKGQDDFRKMLGGS